MSIKEEGHMNIKVKVTRRSMSLSKPGHSNGGKKDNEQNIKSIIILQF